MTHHMERAQQPRHRVHGITGAGKKNLVSSYLAPIGLKDHSFMNPKTHYMARAPPSCHRTPPLIGKTPTPSTWFLKAIKSIAGMYLPPTVTSSFQFHASTKAAEHNKKIIESHGGLQQAIEAQQNSTVSYGSEFHPPWCLHRILHHHPLWSNMTVRLSQGSTYPLNPISDEAKQKDVAAALTYGNHKSSIRNPKFTSNMENEITHGWSLPLPPNLAHTTPDTEVAPQGCVTQSTINELGEIMEKDRVTHDQ